MQMFVIVQLSKTFPKLNTHEKREKIDYSVGWLVLVV